MGKEMMNTKELAQYLGIHEKQVYALIKAKKIPGTRITGKWLFPKGLIDEWIESDSKKSLMDARGKSKNIKGALLAAGSNDPVLDILLTYTQKSHPEFYIFSANTGSTSGMKTLNEGYTDLAWSHLLDPKSGEYNIPFIPKHLPDKKIVVVNLFYREQGILVSQKNPYNIRSFDDLTKDGVRIVNRQKGSGTRILLDLFLEKQGIPSKNIKGYENEVFTHFEVGLSILSGESDAGFGTIAVSNLLGLPFFPLQKERFDMILTQDTFFQKGVQAFIETLGSKEFRGKTKSLGNYDFNDSGKILYSSE